MTAQEIVDRFRSGPVTPVRVQKLRALCQRMAVSYDAVLALLTDEERAEVQG